MPFLTEQGSLALGSRFKSLSDHLYEAADRVYQACGARMQARWFPVLRLLAERGPTPVGDLAVEVGQTHSAISQMAAKLVTAGLVRARSDRGDRRRRLLALSAAGESEVRTLRPVWRAIAAVVDELLAGSHGDFLAGLAAFERALAERPIHERVLERIQADAARRLRVVPWDPSLRERFYSLNAEWLQKHFYIEQIDHDVLSDPERRILAPGGAIFFALFGEEVVGTCALLRESAGVYELTKMAVTEKHQGLGIGRALLAEAIAEFRRRDGRTLFLESNARLAAALRLYASMGFEHQPAPRPDSHYSRSDVYMIWRDPAKAIPVAASVRPSRRGTKAS